PNTCVVPVELDIHRAGDRRDLGRPEPEFAGLVSDSALDHRRRDPAPNPTLGIERAVAREVDVDVNRAIEHRLNCINIVHRPAVDLTRLAARAGPRVLVNLDRVGNPGNLNVLTVREQAPALDVAWLERGADPRLALVRERD